MALGTAQRPLSSDDDTDESLNPADRYYNREFDSLVRDYNKDNPSLGDREASAAHSTDTRDPKEKSVAPHDIREREEESSDPDEGRGRKPKKEDEESWYGKIAGQVARRGWKRIWHKQKKIILWTLAINALVAITLVVISVIAPFKFVHFETVIRTVNMARLHWVVRQNFSRVIFESAVLTRTSVGTYQNSPLIREIIGTTPIRVLTDYGREGRIAFDFEGNRTLGGQLPTSETLRGVRIDGRWFYLDDYAKKLFNGKTYKQLTFRERSTVKKSFIEATQFRLSSIFSWESAWSHWYPYERLKSTARVILSAFANKGRAYIGASPKESRSLYVDENREQIAVPGGGERVTSALPDIEKDAQEYSDEAIEALKRGEEPALAGTPGELRLRMSNRAELARGASDVVMAATLACLGREIAKTFTAEFQRETEAQAIRAGALAMTTTDQIKAGDAPIEAVREANARTGALGSIPDASQSTSYMLGVGQLTGPPVFDRPPPWLDPLAALGDYQDDIQRLVDFMNDSIAVTPIGGPLVGILETLGADTGADTINDHMCAALLNEIVQYSIALAEIIGSIATLGTVKGTVAVLKAGGEAALHAGVGYGIDQAFNWLVEFAVKRFSQNYLAGLVYGADWYEETNVEQSYLAQTGNREINYGRPLSHEEAVEAQVVAMNETRENLNEGSFTERYFAIDNPFSLLGLTVAKIPSGAGGITSAIHNAASFLGSVLMSPFKLVGSLGNNSLLFGRTHAAGSIHPTNDAGVDEWGWTVEEMERTQNDPTFSLEEYYNPDGTKGKNLLDIVEPRLAELDERYGECYTFVFQVDKPDRCDAALLSEYDAEHWRYYKGLSFAAKHLKNGRTR